MATQAGIPGPEAPGTPPGTSRGTPRPRRGRKRPTPFAGSVPMVWIGLVGTVVGFLPTFFLRLASADAAHLVHGWTMTGWLVLVLVQATLIGRGQYRVHRLLGWASLALFVAMVASSLQMMALMFSPHSALPFPIAKFFGYSDFADLPLLLGLFGSAIHFRRDRHLHARLIGATVMTSIVPALARAYNILIWRSMDGLHDAMHPTYWTILATLGVLIWIDRRNGVLRWPLPLAFGWFCVVYATQWIVPGMAWYDQLARALGSLA